MGCGCSRKRSTLDDPVVYGDVTPDLPTLQVMPTITLRGTRRGEKLWVRGSAVQEMVERGWFRVLRTVEPSPT